MKVASPIDTTTMLGARQALREMSDSYSKSGALGRVVFTRDRDGHLTGTDRSRGLWASLSSCTTSKFTDAKDEFYALIRTAYPEIAGALINQLEDRQARAGVRTMLTPGMIKEAQQKASELLRSWGSKTHAADIIAHPLGANPTSQDLAAAIGLMKDGVKPVIKDDKELGDRAQNKLTMQNDLEDPSQFVACHDTAQQLQVLMGKADTAQTAGGAGPEKRAEAIDLAIQSIKDGPCIVQIKGTATADGHSFSLIRKPNGKVDVLEAWASTEAGMDLGSLLGQCKKDIPMEEVIDALRKIVNPDPDVRTEGYTALSTAYDDSARYELWRDPVTEYEEEHVAQLRDDDENIKLEVDVRALKPEREIAQSLAARLELVESYRQDLALTDQERQILTKNHIDLRAAW